MKNNKLDSLKKALADKSDKEQARVLQGFFKTGKGEYGEGDVFLGVRVPQQRMLVKDYYDLGMEDTERLLDSKVHEERFCALLILMEKYKKGDVKARKAIFDFYIKNSKKINNWDLVDVSAPKIVGDHLSDKGRKILYKFAKSDNLWQRRIAILASFAFICKGDFEDTLRLSEILLDDEHDLIRKAVGWMLREVGKRDQRIEEKFLKENISGISSITLRYAIEKFSEEKKKSYMQKQKTRR